MWPGERFSVLPSGELHIRDVQAEDSYVSYRCTTRNILTGEEKVSDPATLFVIGEFTPEVWKKYASDT